MAYMEEIKDIKEIVASNLVKYRKEANLTQSQLAEKINYTDKAISKWERGESLPDIYVLKMLADIYKIDVSALLREKTRVEKLKTIYHNKIIITILSYLLVWLVATACFAFIEIIIPDTIPSYFAFIYAIPVGFIVLIVFNNIWGKRKFNIILVSLLTWTVITSLFLTLMSFSSNMWMLFLIGAVLQLLIIFWYMLDLKKRPHVVKMTDEEKKFMEDKLQEELDKARHN